MNITLKKNNVNKYICIKKLNPAKKKLNILTHLILS